MNLLRGTKIFGDTFLFLGPTEEYYKSLLSHFRGTPEPATSIGLLGMVQKTGESISKYVQDLLHINYLDDEDSTSPENNSSTIILAQIDGHKILFMVMLEKRAIESAISYAHSLGIPLNDLTLFDVPHHGSKHNFGKTMMEHIHSQTAYISAPANSEKHPSSKVTNHLYKKGVKTYTTQGRQIYSFNGVALRPGWVPLTTTIAFQPTIEL